MICWVLVHFWADFFFAFWQKNKIFERRKNRSKSPKATEENDSKNLDIFNIFRKNQAGDSSQNYLCIFSIVLSFYEIFLQNHFFIENLE